MSTLSPSLPTLAPTTAAEVQTAVCAGTHLLPRAGGTKPALSSAPPGVQVLDLSRLSGILEYEPGEFVFTALAGTPLREVAAALAAHGQAMPFDPPLVATGATLGGTIAAGLSGSGRYRFGGLRDFIIGVRLIDGAGRLVRGGGKVVKNAAGFDLPKLMVGSLGRLGVIVEASFKVFPAPAAQATLRVPYPDVTSALAALARLRVAALDLEALDLAPAEHGHGMELWVRIGGPAAVLSTRLERLAGLLGAGRPLDDTEAAAWWSSQAEFTWAPAASALVKVALTMSKLAVLEGLLAATGAARRYAVGGELAWVAWPGAINDLALLLNTVGLSGLVLRGESASPIIGMVQDTVLRRRVAAALDPEHRFLGYEA